MIDTGCELNLIKENVIDPRIWVNRTRIFDLVGIGSGIIKSLGEVKLEIKGIESTFQIVPKDFPIGQNGILGTSFLGMHRATLRFSGTTLHLGLENSFNNIIKIKLPARSKTLTVIPLKETDLEQGYIGKINAGPGIYLGEALVSRNGNFAKCYATNITSQDIELSLSPIDLKSLQEYTVVSPCARTSAYSPLSPEGQKERATRLAALLRITDLKELNEKESQSMLSILGDYLYQFHLPGDKLGSTTEVSHEIITVNKHPINQKQYRSPQILKEEIRKQVQDLYKNDIIQPSNSPYNSPLWIVPKKPDAHGNKRWRMVIDFRLLNEQTVGDAYPLPNITDILDQLGGARYFSVLDLASGFHQIPLHPDSRAKTAFSTPYGHLEFTRMPFGLKNAPATFQRLMDRVLTGLQGIELFVYMDDIVVYGNSLEDHSRKLRALLGRLKSAGLTLQPDKCHFLKKEITYLGHVITQSGVKPDPRKIEAVKDFPVPRSQKNVKQFLGLIGYYRRFIQDFAKIAKILNNLLKKGNRFQWTRAHQKAFEILRDKICREPILQFPKFDEIFIVTTDASNFALGAVLSQGTIGRDLPISFASRSLNPAEINYFTTEKELLAIVWAVQHFRPYLYGRKFTLVTDHRPLIWLHNLKDPISRMARWKIKLSEYEYEIVYKPGSANINADALSRNPCDSATCHTIVNNQSVVATPPAPVDPAVESAHHTLSDGMTKGGGNQHR